MDAIVTAGGVPKPGEPLYEYTQGESKALLDIAGKPMAQWVLDALTNATRVDRIVLMGVDPDCGLHSPKISAFLPNQGHMVNNIRAGILKMLELENKTRRVLVVSSDIPTITGPMVDWVVQEAERSDADAYYNVITRQVMEARFPNSKRSYVHLKNMDVCGGDLNLLRTSLVESNVEFWERLIESRKNAFKQAALVGYGTLFLLMLRQLTLEQAVRRVTRRIKISGQAIVCPYAEIGMDIDKPGQLEMLRADLEKRTAGSAP